MFVHILRGEWVPLAYEPFSRWYELLVCDCEHWSVAVEVQFLVVVSSA